MKQERSSAARRPMCLPSENCLRAQEVTAKQSLLPVAGKLRRDDGRGKARDCSWIGSSRYCGPGF